MFNELRNKLFGYTPTHQEDQFINIVGNLLDHPKTSLKMSPVSNMYFIINDQLHYYILIKDQGIQLTNTKFSFSKSIHPKAYDALIETIHSYIESDRQILEARLFKNESEILDKVLSDVVLKF